MVLVTMDPTVAIATKTIIPRTASHVTVLTPIPFAVTELMETVPACVWLVTMGPTVSHVTAQAMPFAAKVHPVLVATVLQVTSERLARNVPVLVPRSVMTELMEPVLVIAPKVITELGVLNLFLAAMPAVSLLVVSVKETLAIVLMDITVSTVNRSALV
jgi:hypothetical protein